VPRANANPDERAPVGGAKAVADAGAGGGEEHHRADHVAAAAEQLEVVLVEAEQRACGGDRGRGGGVELERAPGEAMPDPDARERLIVDGEVGELALAAPAEPESAASP
jgi:hypothetical protein